MNMTCRRGPMMTWLMKHQLLLCMMFKTSKKTPIIWQSCKQWWWCGQYHQGLNRSLVRILKWEVQSLVTKTTWLWSPASHGAWEAKGLQKTENEVYYRSHVMCKQYQINKGLKVFGEWGEEVSATELRQLHVWDVLDPRGTSEQSTQERASALEWF